jgi:hypothetical protein
MNKIKACLVVLLFFFQGAILVTANARIDKNIEEIITIDNYQLVESNSHKLVEIKGFSQYASLPGLPLRPMKVESYIYPFGTKINSVSVTFSNSKQIPLSKPLSLKTSPKTSQMGIVETYPQSSISAIQHEEFFYTIDSGIRNHEHVVYLNVYIIPVSYDPTTLDLTLYEKAVISIEKTIPKNPITFANNYDMVIITSPEFKSAVSPLIDHKQAMGVSTMLMTTDEIYTEYSGTDNAEQIKYFIKDMIETNGISYVLLIGGRSGGVLSEKWYVPVRYSHVDDDAETSFISDLYYGDIYDAEGKFADWDTNGNGVYAEWNLRNKDILGLYPDVYVGRLPCRNANEVTIAVEKIINYETMSKGSWFHDMVVVGGDSAPGDDFYEGEEENKQALTYMDEFHGISQWTSDGSFTGPDSVMNAINPGCGFLFFDGHANPASWSTHPPNDEETWITGLTVFDMPKLSNEGKYPVCVVGGCHIAQFNVSPLNIIKDLLEYGLNGYIFGPPYQFYHMEWVPKCWSWQLASMKQKGSIATLGYTGLDWFATGDFNEDGIPDCTQYYSGFMNTHFFKNYGQNNIHVLGEAHTQTLIDFLTVHPPMEFELDCKTIQEFVLLGDPSLQME